MRKSFSRNMLRLNGVTEQEILETIKKMRENPIKTV